MQVDSQIQSVPTTLTAVPNISTDFKLVGFLFNNATAAQVTVRLTDGNGVDVQPVTELVPGQLLLVPGFLLPVAAGAQWIAGAAGVKGQVWGYR